MTTSLTKSGRLTINEQTVQEVKEAPLSPGVSVSLQKQDGTKIRLTPNVERLLLNALASIARNGEVTISRVPEQLTSTVAADMLGVSRPTLMKWARDGRIDSFKVGSHTRFERDEVLRIQDARSVQRKKAFEELRSSEWENRELFEE